jgi:hypothetical protein
MTKEPFDTTALVALSSTVASLTEEANTAFSAYKKAKGARVSERHGLSSDNPENRKWREREFDYVSSYYALKEKTDLLGQPLVEFGAELERLRQYLTRGSIDEQRRLVEHSRVQERATEVYLEFELLDVPTTTGGFNATVSSILFTGRRFSIRRSIAFQRLGAMSPAIPLTYGEAVSQAKSWMELTATGNVEVFELATGKAYKVDELPAPRLPMAVAEAKKLAADDNQPEKKLYAAISLIHHAASEPTGGFDSSPCWKGYRIELDFVEKHSRKLCRCGANIRLGGGESSEDHYSGCCSGN